MSTAKKDLLKAIHQKCMDCTCYQIKEVRLCPSEHCALWQFRMGKDPNKTARPISEAQKAALEAGRQNLRK